MRLNTLAQAGTNFSGTESIIVNGNGTDLENKKAIKGRAKHKMITNKMTLSLINVANENKDFDRLKGYWNTYHCQSKRVGQRKSLPQVSQCDAFDFEVVAIS